MTNIELISMIKNLALLNNKKKSKNDLYFFLGLAGLLLGIGIYRLYQSNKENIKEIAKQKLENENLKNINNYLSQDLKENQKANDEMKREIFSKKEEDEKHSPE